ncbi:MAG: XdhC family protein, partial [Legionellales bacterium]
MNKLILHEIGKNILTNIHSWIVTVISTEGSTPGKIGSKILINASGDITGTIGGGGIEKRVIDKIMQEKPRNVVKWNFDLG